MNTSRVILRAAHGALLSVLLGACAATQAAAPDLDGWTTLRGDAAIILVPPGETPAAVRLQRLPDQPAQADFARQLLQWRDALGRAAGGRIDAAQAPVFGRIERGDWGSWAGRVYTPAGPRWWLFMARREQTQVLGVLLDAADAARYERHGRTAAEYFHAATAGNAEASVAAAPISARSLVGVWTNLPAPADTAQITRARLLAAAGSGLWLELRADGTMRYASKAPRAATAPGLNTMAGNAMLVTGGDHLDGRYQEGRWRVEGDELVLTFERGRHLDAIDDAGADKSWYRGSGRRYPMQWTSDGRLRLAVMPGQWMDPMVHVPGP